MCGQCSRAHAAIAVEVRQNRRIPRGKPPLRRGRPHVIDMTRKIDLRVEPLNFTDSVVSHRQHRAWRNSFVKPNETWGNEKPRPRENCLIRAKLSPPL